MAGWLTGWDQRIKLTIDHTKVDAALSHFPVTVFLTSTHGDCVFDELIADANRFKIAFTKADGTTELYGEIEKWDDAAESAIIHVSLSGWSISSSADTDFYMYYDVDHADNTTYIGDIDSTPGHSVWDSDFKLVCHMVDATTSTVKDSTSNNNDGTKGSAGYPEETDGNIGKRQVFSSTNYITISAAASLKFGTGDFSVECVFRIASALQDTYGLMSYGDRHDSKGWTAYIGAAGVAKFIIDDGTTQVVLEDAADHTDDIYHAYATCMDRDGDGVVYIDGGAVKTGSIAGANLSMDTVDHDDIELGRLWYEGAHQYYFIGSEDEIRISACNRSAAWIKATYNSLWNTLLTYGSEEVGGTMPIFMSNYLRQMGA